MSISFREYFRAEFFNELLTSLFLRGKHPRITAFVLLLLIGGFWLMGSIFRLIWKILSLLLGSLFNGILFLATNGKNKSVRRSEKILKRASRKKKDTASPFVRVSNQAEKEWWKSEVFLSGNQEHTDRYIFFIHEMTGELRVFFLRDALTPEPIALAPYFLELKKDLSAKESESIADIYQILRLQYHNHLQLI